MSLFTTRRKRAAVERRPAAFDRYEVDAAIASVEGITLDRFVAFVALTVGPTASIANQESAAARLGFPAGRYDLIRAAWMAQIYASPALAREFGERLDAERAKL
jgi:hypothetical protein